MQTRGDLKCQQHVVVVMPVAAAAVAFPMLSKKSPLNRPTVAAATPADAAVAAAVMPADAAVAAAVMPADAAAGADTMCRSQRPA